MKVGVAGLWHLGTVTAACLANLGHEVIAYDSDVDVINKLRSHSAPISEPGLNELLSCPNLTYSHLPSSLHGLELIWITYDTPVDDNDKADIGFVITKINEVLDCASDGTVILVSSQLPIGTISQLEKSYKHLTFVCSPENLRLGKALDSFYNPHRVIVGARGRNAVVQTLLETITSKIEWMSIESAEMSKHALNAFLATSITFINEIASLCEVTGASAMDVSRALKSDHRIGPAAYLSPGSAFAGGTLARDVTFLSNIGENTNTRTLLISSIWGSNEHHKSWAKVYLQRLLNPMHGKTVTILGLSYKPDTDVIRRSSSVELCRWLVNMGASVRAHDPVVSSIPDFKSNRFELFHNSLDALEGSDVLVIGTQWSHFKMIHPDNIFQSMRTPIILDADGFLKSNLSRDQRIRYITVGEPNERQ